MKLRRRRGESPNLVDVVINNLYIATNELGMGNASSLGFKAIPYLLIKSASGKSADVSGLDKH